MAEEKKDSPKKAPAKKAAAKKPAAKKAAAKKPAAKKAPAKKAAAEKPVAKKAAAEKAESGQSNVTVKARAGYVRVAPRKARLVADQVRGRPLQEAIALLRFSPRGAARDLEKLLRSAAANAENNHDLVADHLRVSEIRVDEGPTLRRYRPRAMGRATRINKRTSHISVALTPEEV